MTKAGKRNVLALVVALCVGAAGLLAWGMLMSEFDTTHIEEIDTALAALEQIRAKAAPDEAEGSEMLADIEEHETVLDILAIHVFRLRGESSKEVQQTLARIRAYREKYPRTTSMPELDAAVREALGQRSE
ncbi:hypothetical protein ACFPN2_14770 [Steroidobacter flavus]|uniref:Uncharacterized protein n=1 Tax=Steroidobacter flavus TaxID=1842136 RepID=A0ABV8STR9_9GAMM